MFRDWLAKALPASCSQVTFPHTHCLTRAGCTLYCPFLVRWPTIGLSSARWGLLEVRHPSAGPHKVHMQDPTQANPSYPRTQTLPLGT